jgi:signal transduction histidine kinase
VIAPCDAAAVAAQVVDAVRAHLPPQVSLQLEADRDASPVAADPDKLRQVLLNLVENAVKYSDGVGAIAMRVERSNECVRFAVSDHGRGIPPEDRERIFEKFHRLDPNMRRGVGGTGLGLYISRELVRSMNGRIWVESELGQGSTFYVELPRART